MASFNPTADAAAIKKAVKGLGTDEKALNAIFGSRTKEQLLQVAKAYHEQFNVTLEKDIRGDTSGNYETLLVWLAKPVSEVRCALLKYATKGAGTAERYLIDVLAPSSNQEILDIYQTDPTAIAAVTNDVSHGDFAKVVNKLLKAKRIESTEVNDDEAVRIAEQLYKAGEGKLGTDEDTFTEIVTTYSHAFLRRVSLHYADKHKHSLELAIKKETSGHYEDILVALLKPKLDYFAERFWKATHGLGTDDKFLCYALSVLSREELVQVARLFREKHPEITLYKQVADDVSGDYGNLCKLLLAHTQ
jgi:hypothetical protein